VNPDLRLAQLEQDIADVEQAMRSMEEIHQTSGGRGGQPAADEIAAVVSGDRFPIEFQLRNLETASSEEE
jgi:hypothetical protein